MEAWRAEAEEVDEGEVSGVAYRLKRCSSECDESGDEERSGVLLLLVEESLQHTIENFSSSLIFSSGAEGWKRYLEGIIRH